MKKLVFSLLLIAFANAAFAQLSGFGFRPALTMSTYKLSKEYNDLYDGSLRPGAGLAAFMEFNLGNRFTIQPEVSFTQRGANLISESTIYWQGPEFGYPVDVNITQHKLRETLNYIDIPVMFEKNFGGGSLGAYVAAGPALSFAVSGKGREEFTIEDARPSEAPPVRDTERREYEIEMGSGRNDLYKGFDLSLNAGAGVLFIMDSGELGLDFRFTQGLKYLNADGLKNRNMMFGVSYMFYIGQ